MRKIGDKVIIRHDLEETTQGPSVVFNMLQYAGKKATIVEFRSDPYWGTGYVLDVDRHCYIWTDEMFEPETQEDIIESSPKVKIKRMYGGAFIPKYQTEGASGFDLVCPVPISIEPGELRLVGIGLRFEIPAGYEMQIRPRSGFAQQWPNYIANSPGTIDSDYRGEVKIGIINNTDYTMFINQGDRIAQGVICPVAQAQLVEVGDLGKTLRAAGGFGSTGRGE